MLHVEHSISHQPRTPRCVQEETSNSSHSSQWPAAMGMIKKWPYFSGTDRVVRLGRSSSYAGHKAEAATPKWRTFWRKMIGNKKRVASSGTVELQASYDLDTYLQNFDQGPSWAEPDVLSRSFSARYADPSRILQRGNTEYGKER